LVSVLTALLHGAASYRAGVPPLADALVGYYLLKFRLCEPRAEGSLHIRMGKKRATEFPQHWAIDDADHICTPRYLLGGNPNLNAVMVAVGNGRAKDDTI
jgi:hypothetical protein